MARGVDDLDEDGEVFGEAEDLQPEEERPEGVDRERPPRESGAGQVEDPARKQIAGSGAGGAAEADPEEAGHASTGTAPAPRSPRSFNTAETAR